MLSHIVGLVTGGASGLGAATATSLIRQGARVVVADLASQRDAYHRLADSIRADISTDAGTRRITFAETDVTSPEQVTQALDAAETAFGEPVNAAINCAGIAAARKLVSVNLKKGQVRVHSLDEFSQVMRVNVDGSFNVARLAAERMMTREIGQDGLRGCIIHTASIAAYDGQMGQTAYAASKGAIVSMTLPMARDLAEQRIRVMTIAPGLFQTPLLDALPEVVKQELGATVPCPSRLGDPNEFGHLVVAILTNPMLNGEVIRLDGALRMPPK
jgi:3-hydroxyacyl-CoA dehydrogenase / 3-hydroxy-2-methylbutyryl-CoA dehydrogenase